MEEIKRHINVDDPNPFSSLICTEHEPQKNVQIYIINATI